MCQIKRLSRWGSSSEDWTEKKPLWRGETRRPFRKNQTLLTLVIKVGAWCRAVSLRRRRPGWSGRGLPPFLSEFRTAGRRVRSPSTLSLPIFQCMNTLLFISAHFTILPDCTLVPSSQVTHQHHGYRKRAKCPHFVLTWNKYQTPLFQNHTQNHFI